MKVIERVFEGRTREKVKIDAAMEFGFMPAIGLPPRATKKAGQKLSTFACVEDHWHCIF